MPVNGIGLKEGQVWLDARGNKRVLEMAINSKYPWNATDGEDETVYTYTDDGMYYGDKPSILDLVTLVSEKEVIPTKFNPERPQRGCVLAKPGDKIICNNGLEFVCCTLETLNARNDACLIDLDATVFGYSESDRYSWMQWSATDSVSDDEWGIKEVIPQQTKENNMTENQDKQEKTYTLEDIKKIFVTLGWSDAFVRFSKNLSRETDPEYQKYIELKAKFEDKE